MFTTRTAALLPSSFSPPMKKRCSRRRRTLPLLLLRRRRRPILKCKKSEEEDDVVVIVSGALGFIGSHCVQHLLRERTSRDIIDNVLVVGIDVTSKQLGPCPMEHKKANLKRLLLLSSSNDKKSSDDDDDSDAKFVFVEGYLSLSAMDAMEKQLKNVIFDNDDGKKKKKRENRFPLDSAVDR